MNQVEVDPRSQNLEAEDPSYGTRLSVQVDADPRWRSRQAEEIKNYGVDYRGCILNRDICSMWRRGNEVSRNYVPKSWHDLEQDAIQLSQTRRDRETEALRNNAVDDRRRMLDPADRFQVARKVRRAKELHTCLSRA